MTTETKTTYPTETDHVKAWQELAQGIASIRNNVSDDAENILPPAKKGELVIIGSGIETLGFAIGEVKLLERADKVLYCVADPATIVWLKQLRPDALDLYVLYGDNKVRYTTYMQMAEAQLYYVRQGLKVVCVFYGHPGVFVLSTHRAITIARREGHKATMKAGVCALDTLCADLGVDPCHPGLQTHEATDMLVRRRKPDPSLHVVLWQVGLIGEMGFRRHGYLNNNFSLFISYLQEVYGDDYPVTHYVGSRYPTIDPVIELYKLSELHHPETQTKITGLSTFYITPKDVVPSDAETVVQLGLIKKHQVLITPKSPLREIDKYGPREMKAFEAFEQFSIPTSYSWQHETEASKFLIELRFDIDLQELYEKDPVQALNDPRFKNLSDRERSMLATRDSGAIQVAVKGNYIRSEENERLLHDVFAKKKISMSLLKSVKGFGRVQAQDAMLQWGEKNGYKIELGSLSKSIDYINRNNLFPWTGVYLDKHKKMLVIILGNRSNRQGSLIYVNGARIGKYSLVNGAIRWKASAEIPFNGFIRMDVDMKGNRRWIGKTWTPEETAGDQQDFTACEVDPDRANNLPVTRSFLSSGHIKDIAGTYAVRTNGRHPAFVNLFVITENTLQINGENITDFSFENGVLSWSGGNRDCYSGRMNFLLDPIIRIIETYGHSQSKDFPQLYNCYGASTAQEGLSYTGPEVPAWAKEQLKNISLDHTRHGGLMLWHKWEISNYSSMAVNKVLFNLA